MNLVDSHCHLNLEHFSADRPDVLARARAHGVYRLLVPGLTPQTSQQVTALAASHPQIYAAVGVHPNDAASWTPDTPATLRNLLAHPKTVAIGEIGLDYYWDAAPPSLQKEILQAQLQLAAEHQRPVILHSRDKNNALEGPCLRDLLDILTAWVAALRRTNNPLARRPGVWHAFSGSLAAARQVIQLGFAIGVGGPVTFKNARQRQRIVAALPLENLLLETDAPFLAPHPHRGQRNEPAFVALVAGKIAELKAIPLEKVASQTSVNAANLFSWGA